MNRRACLLLATLPLGACAAPQAAPPLAIAVTAPSPAMTAAQAHDALFALFKASDEDSLKRNPLDALFRGDLRYADRFGDYISDDYFNASRAAATSDLTALQAIDRGLLSPTAESRATR